MLEMKLGASKETETMSIWDTNHFNFKGEEINTARHCFGCTAGAGSSCTGSLST
jgi:hypothetical protein